MCMCVYVDVLCVDAIIQSEEAHMELCRALRASRTASARLKLRIGRLDMSSLGVPRTVVLLEQVEPEVLLQFALEWHSVEHIARPSCKIVSTMKYMLTHILPYGVWWCPNLTLMLTLNVMHCDPDHCQNLSVSSVARIPLLHQILWLSSFA